MGSKVDYKTDHTAGRRRLDLKTAAAELGVTSEAIRRRAKRGTLPSEKGEDGLLYVWLPSVSDTADSGSHIVSDNGAHGRSHSVPDAEDARLPEALLERYEDENTFLRQKLERLHRELERKDAMLLTLAQRVPELEPAQEAPSEPLESLHTPSEDAGKERTAAPGGAASSKVRARGYFVLPGLSGIVWVLWDLLRERRKIRKRRALAHSLRILRRRHPSFPYRPHVYRRVHRGLQP